MQQMISSLDLVQGGSFQAGVVESSDRLPGANPLKYSLVGASSLPPAPSPAPPPEMSMLASAPNPHLVKAAVAKAKEVAESLAKGDLHFTQHGCHCLLDWEHEGVKQEGCSPQEVSFSKGHHWCKVNEPCRKNQGVLEGPEGEKEPWDYCSLPGEISHEQTIHGCHCAPHWEFADVEYGGCSRTSLGPMWCYIFETDAMCKEALRTEHGGQHWDYCFVHEQTSPYLTTHGCHCMPEWTHDDVKYMGCATVPNEHGEAKPWCITLEDASECPMGLPQKEGDSMLIEDSCSMPRGKEDVVLKSLALAGKAHTQNCHCQPFWEHLGVEYKNCASTPDRPRLWCYLLEDERRCPEADGEGEGKEERQRWRYCEESAKKQENVTAEGGGKDEQEESEEAAEEEVAEDEEDEAGEEELRAEGNGTEQVQNASNETGDSPTKNRNANSANAEGNGRDAPEEDEAVAPATKNQSSSPYLTAGESSAAADAFDEVDTSAPFKFELAYSEIWKKHLAGNMTYNLRSMGLSEEDLDYDRVTVADAEGNVIEIGDKIAENMFPLRVTYMTQPAFQFKVKLSEDWREDLARTMHQAMESLGISEENLDPTRVIMRDVQGRVVPIGQNITSSRFPLSISYKEAPKPSTPSEPEKSYAPQMTRAGFPMIQATVPTLVVAFLL